MGSGYKPLGSSGKTSDDYGFKFYIYRIIFSSILLIPMAVHKIFRISTNLELYGLCFTTWCTFLFAVIITILFNMMMNNLVIDLCKRVNNGMFHYYSKILYRSRNMVFYCTLCLFLIIVFDCFFPADCEGFLTFNPADPKQKIPYPDECKIHFIRKLLICGVTTSLGLFLVKWIIIAISNIYQEKVFRDRILLNKYHLYVANLLYEGCKEEGMKKGIQIDDNDVDSGDSESNSFTSDTSFESQYEKDYQERVETENQFKQKSKFVSAIIRIVKRENYGNDGKLSESHEVGKSSSHVKIFPLLDFNSFKKTIKLFKSDFTLESNGDYDNSMLTSNEAKKRSKFIFKILMSYSSNPSRGYLTIKDIQRICKSKTSATEAYRIFDINNDGQMTRSELKRSFIHIFRETYNLKQSILSSADALSALDATLSGILFLVLILIYMIIFGIHLQSLLTLSLSLILGFSTITGNMSKDMFDSLCFLFITHPFDIGDCIKMDGDDNIYEVRKIYVLRTEFTDSYGEEVYIPNPTLIRKNIINLRRSDDQWEAIDMYVSTSTKEEQLYNFRSDLTKFLKENTSFFHHKFDMESKDNSVKGLDIFHIKLRIQCKVTKDNMRKSDRHHFLLNFIKIELEKLNIVYYPNGPGSAPKTYSENEAIEASKRNDHFRRHLSITAETASGENNGNFPSFSVAPDHEKESPLPNLPSVYSD